jgi:hypothetical protein
MSDRGKLTVALVLLALLAACGLFTCVGFGALVAGTPEFDASAEQAARDGDADGRAGTSDLCLERAHARAEACGAFSPDCQNIAREYLLTCLRAVPEPRPELCTGAPARASLFPDLAFSDSVCAPRGWPVDGWACDTVVAALETHCEVRSAPAPR